MLHVSPTFMQNSVAPARKIACRAVLEVSPPLVFNSDITVKEYVGDVLSTEPNDRGIPRQVVDSVQDTSYRYAMLDGYWELGNNMALAGGTIGKRGWVSMSLCDGTATFSPSVSMIVMVPGDIEANSTSHSIMIAFDTRRNEWGEDFDVVLLSNDTIVPVGTVQNNEKAVCALPIIVSENIHFDGYGIRVRRWSHPGRTCKVSLCYYGDYLEFTEEDLLGLRISAESGTVYSGTEIGAATSSLLVMEVANIAGRLSPSNPQSKMYRRKPEGMRLLPSMGFSDELVGVGAFYLESWPSDDQNSVLTATAGDAIALLSHEHYDPLASSLTYPCTLPDLLTDILMQISFGMYIEYPDMPMPVISYPLIQEESVRKLLSDASMLLSCRLVSTPYGSLKFLAPNAQIETSLYVDMENYHSLSAPSWVKRSITMVYVDWYDSELVAHTITVGSLGGDAIAVPGNFLLQREEDAIRAGQAIISSGVANEGERYLVWRGNPALVVGDVIEVADRYGGQQRISVDNLAIHVGAGMQSTLSGRVLADD